MCTVTHLHAINAVKINVMNLNHRSGLTTRIIHPSSSLWATHLIVLVQKNDGIDVLESLLCCYACSCITHMQLSYMKDINECIPYCSLPCGCWFICPLFMVPSEITVQRWGMSRMTVATTILQTTVLQACVSCVGCICYLYCPPVYLLCTETICAILLPSTSTCCSPHNDIHTHSQNCKITF